MILLPEVLLDVRIEFISFLKMSRSKEDDCGETDPLILLVSVSDRVNARIKLRDSPSSSLSSSSSKSIIRVIVSSLVGMPIFFNRLETESSFIFSNASDSFKVDTNKTCGLPALKSTGVKASSCSRFSLTGKILFGNLTEILSFFFIEISKGIDKASLWRERIDSERELESVFDSIDFSLMIGAVLHSPSATTGTDDKSGLFGCVVSLMTHVLVIDCTWDVVHSFSTLDASIARVFLASGWDEIGSKHSMRTDVSSETTEIISDGSGFFKASFACKSRFASSDCS